jgi:TonB-like protein
MPGRSKPSCMSWRRALLMGALVTYVASSGQTDASALNASTTAPPQGVVVLTKLSEPVYPLIARTAHISGDVELMLQVRQDGRIESATVVSGPPLLQKSALTSANQSLFECHGCNAEPTAYRLVYSFQLVESGCCAEEVSKTTDGRPPPTYPQTTQSPNRVAVIDQAACICDPAGQIGKVRSLKCLSLWRCAIHKW